MNQPHVFTDIFSHPFQKELEAVFRSPFSGPVSVNLAVLADSIEDNKKESPFTKWLDKQEREKFASFKFSKRYIEWLGGRLCAKKALANYIQKFYSLQIIPPPDEMTVLSNQDGRPYFHSDPLKKTLIAPDLSISHSGRYGIAFVSQTWCGIDIQEIQPSLIKVKEKYCGKLEENILLSFLLAPNFNHLHCLTLLWAAKEALRKMLSRQKLTGFLDMNLKHIEIMNEGIYLFTMKLRDKSLVSSGQVKVITTFQRSVGAAFCQLPKTTISHDTQKQNA